MNDELPTDAELLAEHADRPFVQRLHEKLSPEQVAFVIRLLTEEDYCGNCFDVGPWCCYDPQS